MKRNKEEDKSQVECQEISIELLKFQNTALSSKLDIIRKEQQKIKLISEKQEKVNQNFECLFTHFFSAWRVFMDKLGNIHQFIKKSGETRLTDRFTQTFDLLQDVITLQSKIRLDENNIFTKNSKQKIEQFVRSIENIYTELIIEHIQYNDRIQTFFKELTESKDANTIVRQAHQYSQEARKQFADNEGYFKQKTTLYQNSVQSLELEFDADRCNELKKELEDIKLRNESLTRRLRILNEYNFDGIKLKIEKTMPLEIEVGQEQFDCICGGSQIANFKNLPKLVAEYIIKEKLNNTNLIGNVSNFPNNVNANSVSNINGNTVGGMEQANQVLSDATHAQIVANQFLLIKDNSQTYGNATLLNSQLKESGLKGVGNTQISGHQSNSQGGGIGHLVSCENMIYDEQYLLTYKQSLQLKEEENKKLKQEKCQLFCDFQKYKQQQKSIEEQLFNSKIFQNLVSQGQDLLKYANNLKQQLSIANAKILEIEKLRQKELAELNQKENEEKERLMNEINQLKTDQLQQFYTNKIKLLLAEYTPQQYTGPLFQRIDEFQRIAENNEKNKMSMLNKINELEKSLEDERKSKADLLNKFNKSELDQILILGKLVSIFSNYRVDAQDTGNFNSECGDNQQQQQQLQNQYKQQGDNQQQLFGLQQQLIQMGIIQEFSYRHQTIKEYLQVLEEGICKSGSPLEHLKDKFNEIKNYIRHREKKIEQLEYNLKTNLSDNSNLKNQNDMLIKDIETTNQGYSDLEKQVKNLTAQLKQTEEKFSNLISQKIQEKVQFDQEKQTFQIKIKADSDKIIKQDQIIEELNAQIQLLQKLKIIQDEEVNSLKSLNDNLKQMNEDVTKQQEDHRIEVKQLTELKDKYSDENGQLQKELQELKNELVEIQLKLEKKVQQERDGELEEVQKIELDSLREKTRCSSCKRNEKKQILAKCMHLFCKECIDNNMKVRNRQCPICQTKFGQEDIKEFYWAQTVLFL